MLIQAFSTEFEKEILSFCISNENLVVYQDNFLVVRSTIYCSCTEKRTIDHSWKTTPYFAIVSIVHSILLFLYQRHKNDSQSTPRIRRPASKEQLWKTKKKLRVNRIISLYPFPSSVGSASTALSEQFFELMHIKF